ncbi:MAG: DUF2634 domain-containing protein [Clostridia bacterium]|nr:DUF2634 domain-containing protein [Clostridia bacterium]
MLTPITGIDLGKNIKEKSKPGYTYRMDIKNKRLVGMVDEMDAIKQSVYKILSTERYKYLIYDWRYGRELEGLIGKSPYEIQNEIHNRVKEALLMDDRILDVTQLKVMEIQDEKYIPIILTLNTTEGQFTTEVVIHV